MKSMLTSQSNVWRDLLEIRQILKEVAIRHNIHDEDDESHIILDELKNQDETELGPEPESLSKLTKEEINKNQNIFERIDVEEIQRIVTKALMKESLMEADEKSVEVSFDLDMKVFGELAFQAHLRDITFNEFVVEIIETHIKKITEEEEKSTT